MPERQPPEHEEDDRSDDEDVEEEKEEEGVHLKGYRVDQLISWPEGRRAGGLTRSAKVQIGAELLCKSAKVRFS
jgi:hypothetical protein